MEGAEAKFLEDDEIEISKALDSNQYLRDQNCLYSTYNHHATTTTTA